MPILHSTDRRGHPNVFRCDADADILRSMGPGGQTKQRRAAPPAKVLVRPPGRSFRLALSEHPERDRLDPERAARQHAGFVAALRGHGADVVNLPEVADLPDATFVSDTVLVLPPASSPEGPPGLVVFTRPGAETRRAEVEAIARPVRSLVQPGTLEVTVKEPGTLEGGDVIVFGDHLAIGLSARTNREGASQLAEAASAFGYRPFLCQVRDRLHLASAVTVLGPNRLVGTAAGFASLDESGAAEVVQRILLADEDVVAANVLALGGWCFVPAGHPRAVARLESAGERVVSVELDEFERADGGPTCLVALVPIRP